jgi:hypothetical protein
MHSSNPNQADDAWRRLASRLAIFCLPLVLGWAALEQWAARLPNLYSVKRQRLESLANDVDTLIMGSSSAFHDIEPRLLSGSAFNLAGPYETPYEDDHLLTGILPSLPKLKRAIIQIQYPTLFSRLSASAEDWRQYCYQQEWGIPPMLWKNRLDCRMWSRLALRTPRYYLDLLVEGARKWVRRGRFALDQPDVGAIDDRGWCPTEVGVRAPPPDWMGVTEAKRRLGMHHEMMNPEYEKDNLACLDHMLSILRQRKVEVVFVAVPVWPTYRDLIIPECWNETQRLVAQRSNNSSVFYYSFLIAPELGVRDFYDVDHLNSQGAIRFTQLLNSELNKGKQGSDAKTNLLSNRITR